MDATDIGDPVYDDLRRVLPRIEPVKLTNLSRAQLIQRLVVAIEQRQIDWPLSWSVVTDVLKRYEYEITPNGSITYTHPRRLPRRLRHRPGFGQLGAAPVQVDRRGAAFGAEAGGGGVADGSRNAYMNDVALRREVRGGPRVCMPTLVGNLILWSGAMRSINSHDIGQGGGVDKVDYPVTVGHRPESCPVREVHGSFNPERFSGDSTHY